MFTNSFTRPHFALTGNRIYRQSNHSLRKSRTLATIVWIMLVSLEGNHVRPIWAQQVSSEASARDTRWQPVQQSVDLFAERHLDADQHYVRALQLKAAGDETRAEREFKDAVAKTPKEDKCVRGLALFYIDRGRYEDAIGVIAEHVRLCGVTALGYELEAELLFQQKLYGPALEAVLASLKLNDHNARMRQLLGLIHIANRQDGAAVLELRKAAELDPDRASTRYFLGRVLYTTGSYVEARDQFLACLKIEPSYRKALENLGLCYEALQEYLKATQAYHDAIALEETQKGPKHGEPYAFYGAMLARLGESEKALAVLRQAVAVSPKAFVANYHLGRVLLDQGQLEDSERFLLVAANLDAKFSRTYYLLGNLRQRQNRRAEAERYWVMFKDLDKAPENRVFPITDR